MLAASDLISFRGLSVPRVGLPCRSWGSQAAIGPWLGNAGLEGSGEGYYWQFGCGCGNIAPLKYIKLCSPVDPGHLSEK